MSKINNDTEFRQALKGLNTQDQRIVAAKFAEHVLSLSEDERLKRVIKTAGDTDASEDELSSALKSARAATLTATRVVAQKAVGLNRRDIFVARAAVAAVTPEAQSWIEGVALHAAMSSRMARTSMLIDDEARELSAQSENEWQYQALTEYLNAHS